jgi:Protein of unknown function (DUF2490)
MMLKRNVLACVCTLLCAISIAQKIIVSDEQAWFGVFNQTRFSNKWGSWTDVHMRLKNDFIKEPSQFLIRVGPTYYLNDNVRFTVAYNFVNFFPDETHPNISIVEHRPFQQIQWYTKFPKSRMMQWIRLDERFRQNIKSNGTLGEGFNFNWRVRYNYILFLPLSKKGLAPGSIQAVLNDEIMFNFGKNIVYNSFDQNRLFAGLAYQVSPEAHVQLGYMNVFQQLASGNHYKSLNCIRAFYFHNFDLRKKEKNKN